MNLAFNNFQLFLYYLRANSHHIMLMTYINEEAFDSITLPQPAEVFSACLQHIANTIPP